MSDDSTASYAFDAEPGEHLLFLGAVITIVADGTDTGGALTVTETTRRRATRTTSTPIHPASCSTFSAGR